MTLGDDIQKPAGSATKRASNWILWWRTDPVDIDEQARLYDTLSIWSTWRGWSVLCLGFSILITTAMIAFRAAGTDESAFVDVGMMAVLALFISLGHRWALVGAMVLWTLEKIVVVAMDPVLLITQILWWALYMHVFYSAYRVAQRRKEMARLATDPAIFD